MAKKQTTKKRASIKASSRTPKTTKTPPIVDEAFDGFAENSNAIYLNDRLDQQRYVIDRLTNPFKRLEYVTHLVKDLRSGCIKLERELSNRQERLREAQAELDGIKHQLAQITS